MKEFVKCPYCNYENEVLSTKLNAVDEKCIVCRNEFEVIFETFFVHGIYLEVLP